MPRKSQKNLFALPAADLDHVLHQAGRDLASLRGKSLFITGGTGFFGKWLLGVLLHADAELELDLKLTVLSRNPATFAQQFPETDTIPALQFLKGDVAYFSTEHRPFDYILHAATDTTVFTDEAQERERSRSIVRGTQHMIDLAKKSGAQRLLNISSGAVYGTACGKPDGAREEDHAAAMPLTPYASAKREAEDLCATSGIDFTTARAFAFLGPHLALDAHFAAGNFLRDALRGGPVIVRGDGTALRSYLYPADLVVWLLRILLQGQCARAYNVGSDEAITTAQLARLIADTVNPALVVTIQSLQPQGPQNIYLPNIERARTELNLDVVIPLREAIARTVAFHQSIS